MRVTPTKVLNTLTAAVLLILLYTVFNQSKSDHRNYDSTCAMPRDYQIKLHQLTYRVHEVLDGLNLAHFLCYGSLFGQIRQSSTLPWEKDAEYCVLNEEFSAYDELFLKRAFWKRDLDLLYDSAEGRYVISAKDHTSLKDEDAEENESDSAHRDELNKALEELPGHLDGLVVQLIVFADDKDIKQNGGEESMYHRIGWKRRLLPPDCDYSPTLECFPARLALTPLPLKLFGTKAVPVPREEFEILKYHFPDNWWKEVKPLNC